MISWYSVTSAEYKAASASEKTDDKIFYLTDTQQIYRGTKNYTENIIFYNTLTNNPIQGKIYINNSNSEGKVWNGTKWVTIIPANPVFTVKRGDAFYSGSPTTTVYNPDIDDYFAGARSKYNVKVERLSGDDTVEYTFSNTEIDYLFDGNFDTFIEIPAGKKLKVSFQNFNMTYPYGYYMIRSYPRAGDYTATGYPKSITCTLYYKNNGTELKNVNLGRITLNPYSTTSTNERVAFTNTAYYNSKNLEFIVEGQDDKRTAVCEIEMWCHRYSVGSKAFVSKYGPQKLYYELTAPSFKGDLNGTAAKATADADGNAISTTYEKKEATLLGNTIDLATMTVASEGRYYATSGNNITSKPNGVDAFYLELKKIKGTDMIKQVLWAENSDTPYTRNISVSAGTHTDWVRGTTAADSVDIENSLTSDSTTSALAAAQGKILGEMCNSILTNTNQISNGSGFLAGGATSASSGVAIGSGAKSSGGVAIGTAAETGDYSGVAIGINAIATETHGVAIGHTAHCQNSSGNPISAIQIGPGENNTEHTFQVYDYRLMNADGTIPDDRMTSKVSVEEGKSLIDENVASNLSYDDTDSAIKSEKSISLSSVTVQGPTGDQITFTNTNKLTGDGISLESVITSADGASASDSASYTASGMHIASPDGDSAGFSVDGNGNLLIREVGTDNATKIYGGDINTIRLNKATIGDLSEVVATNTTLVSIIKGLQEQVTALGTTVNELQTRIGSKSLIYASAGRSDVPSIYEQLSYLESTGTQYIDSGIDFKNVYGYEVNYQSIGIVKSISTYNLDGIFGVNSSDADTKIWFAYSNDKPGLSIYLRGSSSSVSKYYTSYDEYYAAVHHVKVETNGTVWYNEENIGTFSEFKTSAKSGPLYLFCAYDCSVKKSNFHSKTRIYYSKFCAQDGTLLRDFVPCKRISDGVLGMYDVVSDTFFTNKGTGTFLSAPLY